MPADSPRPDPYQLKVRELPGVVGRADELVRESRKAIDWLNACWDTSGSFATLRRAIRVVETLRGPGHLCNAPGRAAQWRPAARRWRPVGRVGRRLRRSELKQLTLDLKRLERAIEGDGRRLSELIEVHVSRDDAVRAADEVVGRRLEQMQRHVRCAKFATVTANDCWMSWKMPRNRPPSPSSARPSFSISQRTSKPRSAACGRGRSARGIHHGAAAEIDAIDLELRELTNELDAQRVELAKQEERLSGLIESHGRFEKDQAGRVKQRRDAENRFVEARGALARAELAMLSASNEIATLMMQVESLQARAARAG